MRSLLLTVLCLSVAFAAVVDYTVTCGPDCDAADRSYTINGLSDPNITCTVGDTLNFILINIPPIHPFVVEQSGTPLTTAGVVNSSITCTASMVATPAIYRCTIHPDMTGFINAVPALPEKCNSWVGFCGNNMKMNFVSATLETSADCGAACVDSVSVLVQLTGRCNTHYCRISNLTTAFFGVADACPGAKRILNVSFTCTQVQIPLTSGLTDYSNRLNFLLLGDWGGENDQKPTSSVQTAVAAGMTIQGLARNISFVLALGDNFYDAGIDSLDDIRWQQTWLNVYNKPPLSTVTWYPTAGNHDHYAANDALAEIEYSRAGMGGGRWYFPDYNYNLVFPIPGTDRTFQIMQFDTYHLTLEAHRGDIDTTIRDATKRFLDFEAGRSYSHWRMAMTHYPFYSVSLHGTNTELLTSALPAVQNYGADLCVAGHDHNFQEFTANGTSFYVIGNSNKVDPNSGNRGKLPANVPSNFFYPYTGMSTTRPLPPAHPMLPASGHSSSSLRRTVSASANISVGSSRTDVLCSNPNSNAFSAFCPKGTIGINSATFGGSNRSACGPSTCTSSVAISLSAACLNKQNCIINTTQVAQLEVTRNCTGGYLTINWLCRDSTTTGGAFAAMSVGENDMYLTGYNQDGTTIIYEKKFERPVSRQLAVPPPVPFPPPMAPPAPVAPPTVAPVPVAAPTVGPAPVPVSPPTATPMTPTPIATPSATPMTPPVAPPTDVPVDPGAPVAPPTDVPVDPGAPVDPGTPQSPPPPGEPDGNGINSQLPWIIPVSIVLFILVIVIVGVVVWYTKQSSEWEAV